MFCKYQSFSYVHICSIHKGTVFLFVGFKLAQEIRLCLNSFDDHQASGYHVAMLREDTLIGYTHTHTHTHRTHRCTQIGVLPQVSYKKKEKEESEREREENWRGDSVLVRPCRI